MGSAKSSQSTPQLVQAEMQTWGVVDMTVPHWVAFELPCCCMVELAGSQPSGVLGGSCLHRGVSPEALCCKTAQEGCGGLVGGCCSLLMAGRGKAQVCCRSLPGETHGNPETKPLFPPAVALQHLLLTELSIMPTGREKYFMAADPS